MSNTPRSKMSIENRAKQFAPFVGQPGLYEALALVEAEVELACQQQKRPPIDMGGPESQLSECYEELNNEDN